MKSINFAGIKVHNITKREFLSEVQRLVEAKKPSYVVTPYSEFLLRAQIDEEFKNVINNADISLADGIGILIAERYLSMRGNKYTDLVKCLLAPIFNRGFLFEGIKEKLSGSEIIYDVCEMSAKKGYKVFLLGGFDFGKGNTGEIAKKVLKEKYPGLQIVGTYPGSPAPEEEEEIVNIINDKSPDILFVAYGPVKQEKWIARNLQKLVPMVSFCAGGTLDYVAGAKKKVPKHLSDRGLEGILRPFISERGNPRLILRRLQRGWSAMPKFIIALLKERSKK